MNDVKVSIIVPVYNLQKLIRQCVDSLLVQTLTDIEIILVDDGSSDASPAICDEYAERDSRVKVIHQQNMGLSGARNSGISASSGKWFMIVDGDDWLEANAAEVLFANAEKYDSDIFIASFFVNTQHEQKKDSFFKVDEFHYSTKDEMLKLQENCISSNSLANMNSASNMGVTWARLYKKSFVTLNDLSFVVGLKRTQDAIFHLYALEVASKVDYIDIPVHHYRVWSQSASKKASNDFHVTALEIIKHIRKFMEVSGKEEVFSRAYYSKVAKLLLEIVKLELAPKNCKKSFIERRRFLKKLAIREPYANAIKKVDRSTLTSGQKLGCMLLILHMYSVVLVLYGIKENR